MNKLKQLAIEKWAMRGGRESNLMGWGVRETGKRVVGVGVGLGLAESQRTKVPHLDDSSLRPHQLHLLRLNS